MGVNKEVECLPSWNLQMHKCRDRMNTDVYLYTCGVPGIKVHSAMECVQRKLYLSLVLQKMIL